MPKGKKAKSADRTPLQEADELYDQKKYDEAEIKYLEVAQDNGPAKNTLGILALRKDEHDKAFRFFCEAALLNDADGLNNVAYCYENEVGTPASTPHVIYYLMRAVMLRNDSNVQILKEYLEEYAQNMISMLMSAHDSECTHIIESNIAQALVPHPIKSAYQILKLPNNRKIVVDILRLAQKIAVKNPSKNSLAVVKALFKYEFIIQDHKLEVAEDLNIIWAEVYDLMNAFKQYENYFEKNNKHDSKVKIFASIIKKSKLSFLTNGQCQKVKADFLVEIEHVGWALSTKHKQIAREFAEKIQGADALIDITDLLNLPENSENQLTSAIVLKLPEKSNDEMIEVMRLPNNKMAVTQIIDNNIRILMQAMSMGAAVKLIALLEFKEKIFGLEIAPLFFMKLLNDLELVYSNNLVWLLDCLENVDCTDVNQSSGFFTIMRKVLSYQNPEDVPKILHDLNYALVNLINKIDAEHPNPSYQWQKTKSILASYCMAIIAFGYLITKAIHPLVMQLINHENLDKKQMWPALIASLPAPSKGDYQYTYTANAIWFVTTCVSTSLMDMPKDLHETIKTQQKILFCLIEAYDALHNKLKTANSATKVPTKTMIKADESSTSQTASSENTYKLKQLLT